MPRERWQKEVSQGAAKLARRALQSVGRPSACGFQKYSDALASRCLNLHLNSLILVLRHPDTFVENCKYCYLEPTGTCTSTALESRYLHAGFSIAPPRTGPMYSSTTVVSYMLDGARDFPTFLKNLPPHSSALLLCSPPFPCFSR